jgi:hypothetical protein
MNSASVVQFGVIDRSREELEISRETLGHEEQIEIMRRKIRKDRH